jgi:two-component system NtrC family sensor kinase
LLAEATSASQACAQGLEFVLDLTGHPAGAIWLPGEEAGTDIISPRSTSEWASQFADPQSRLRQAAEDVFSAGLPQTSELGVILPIGMQANRLGVLLLAGPPAALDELEGLERLARSLGRSLYTRRTNAYQENMHAELLRSRNTLRALFDNLPSGLYIVDPHYNLVAVNLSRARRAGQTPKLLVGQRCFSALHGRAEPCRGCRVGETLDSGGSTLRNERRGGEDDLTEWEISTYPILDEAEQVVQAIMVEQDVTERRRLEGVLVQSEKLAAVGQLAAGVAHEINNPLTAIIANAQLLQRGLPRNNDLQESIELILRAGERATQVMRNLLDFARKEQYHLAPTDVNDTVQRALALVQHELVSRRIQLEFVPALELPLVEASQDHLLGVWLNILLNAIDALDVESPRLRIVTCQAGETVHVSIADNGRGIPAERLERIFEPFYTTKTSGRGTGLGLSVCRQVIKQHGGQILVESQVGVGTEFTVVLPVKGPLEGLLST